MRSLALITFAAFLVSCGGSGSNTTGTTTTPTVPATPVVTTSVSLQNLAFSPASIEVSPGAVVTFTNNDGGTKHNVTFANTAVGTTSDFTSGSKTLTMPAATGSYAYRCTIHSGMSGTVAVK